LRKIIESEGNQQSKQVEIQKLRDQEIASLKYQLSSAQTELEDTRRKGSATIKSLNSEIASSKQELSEASSEIKQLQDNLASVCTEIDGLKFTVSQRERQSLTIMPNWPY